jgi:hypothetical protein
MLFTKPSGFSVGLFLFFDQSTIQNEPLIAAGFIMIRAATEDTVLSAPNADKQSGMRQVPIPKNLPVIVDVTGIRVLHSLNEENDTLTDSSQTTIRVISLTRTDTTQVGGEESLLNLKILLYLASVCLI